MILLQCGNVSEIYISEMDEYVHYKLTNSVVISQYASTFPFTAVYKG